MSSRERRHDRNSNGIRDIGTFVENYNSLLDKLYPVFAVWDGVLYVTRYTADLSALCVGDWKYITFSLQVGELLDNIGNDGDF